jgi:hypothetical protein
VFASTDEGASWKERGSLQFPDWEFDEHMMIELKDGRCGCSHARKASRTRVSPAMAARPGAAETSCDGAECECALLPASAQIGPHFAGEEWFASGALAQSART